MKRSFGRPWRTKPRVFLDNLKPYYLYGGLVVGALGLLYYNLLSLLPFGAREIPEFNNAASLGQIKQHILFAPSKTLQFLFLKFFDNDILIRLASVICGVVAVILLYVLLRKWYTTRVSLFTIALFATSTWFLHTSRTADHDVLFLSVVPTLLLSCLWLLAKNNNRTLPFVAALGALLLYIPGSWLLIFGGSVVFRKYILKAFERIPKKQRLVSFGIFSLGILPLIYSFIINPSQLIEWLGYDNTQPLNIQTFVNNVVHFANGLVWHGPHDAGSWLIGTPVLDIFTIIMAVLGLYAYRVGYYPAREKLVFSLLGGCTILIIFGGVASISLIIPVVYLLVANGIAYMLQSWFTVFPRNPVARPIGVAVVAVIVSVSCFYNLQRYFVAWPQHPNTKPALLERR